MNKIGIKKCTTYTKTLPCIRIQASITTEAALVVPFFVLFLVLILGLFRVELVETQMNQALSYTVSKVAMEAETDLLEEVKTRAVLLDELKNQECNLAYIENGWQGIGLDMSESDALTVRIRATYQISLPVNVFGKQYVEVIQSAVARRWNGYQSSLYTDNQWVYITPQGTAYHSSSSCSYLDLSIWATDRVRITSLRNKDGSRYDPCNACGAHKKDQEAGTVYVTDYGELYHQSLDCRNLKRTVYRVSLDEMTSRTPCSKCYGR